VTRVPHFDGIAFVALVALVVVLLVSALSWAWVGETLAVASLALSAGRWAHRWRTA
jgi:hypothetical protein